MPTARKHRGARRTGQSQRLPSAGAAAAAGARESAADTEIGRTAIYVRGSAAAPPLADQRALAEAMARKRGWRIAAQFEDAAPVLQMAHARSGGLVATADAELPGLAALLTAASGPRFEAVIVASLDRLGRSLPHLLATLGQLQAASVHVVACDPALDTTCAAPGAFPLSAAWAALAAAGHVLGRESALRGVAATRLVPLSKKRGRPPIDQDRKYEIDRRLAAGEGCHRIARELHTGVETVRRIERQWRAMQAEIAEQRALDAQFAEETRRLMAANPRPPQSPARPITVFIEDRSGEPLPPPPPRPSYAHLPVIRPKKRD